MLLSLKIVEKTSEFVRGRNGIFKNLCNRRSATIKSELVKVAKELWSEIKTRKIRNVIKPSRVDLMVKKLGFQIEHLSQ